LASGGAAAMTLAFADASDRTADWLFAVARDSELPVIDGLVSTRDYDRSRMTPDQVAVMEKARKYNARAVFFEAGRHGRAPIPQALVFDVRDHPDDLPGSSGGGEGVRPTRVVA